MAIAHRRLPRLPRVRPLHTSVLGLALATQLGCPTQAGDPYATKAKAKAAPQVGAEDPRVVEKDGELYPQRTIERAQERQRGTEDEPSLGSGRPDETNGKCRLFSPELPHPECCNAELGFDMETAQKACGLHVYLGESHRYSCGYYFAADDGEGRRWFRLGTLPEATAKEAADHHDRRMKEALGDSFSGSSPVPGVEGAYWSRHENYRWAFLPGWANARQLSWQADSCSDEGIVEVIAQITAAKPAPPGEKRLAQVPKARM